VTPIDTITFLKKVVAETLAVQDPSALPEDEPLGGWGLDSLSSVEIRNRLIAKYQRPLPGNLLFDFPTIRKLAGYLDGGARPSAGEATVTRGAPDVAIAVIGMSCRFPGHCNSPEELWSLLKEGRSGIVDMVDERWNADTFYDSDVLAGGKINTKFFGLLDNVKDFDADFFGISPTEAVSLDPQQRLLLEVIHETIERAGYGVRSLAGREVGVFIGMMNQDYLYLNHPNVVGEGAEHSAYYASGHHFSAASGRIAYSFDWTGPTMAVDTACSSSLVALHLACQSLRDGECEQAVVAGVNLILTPEASIEGSNAGMLSPTGRCHSFDARADGYVRSEGCGALLLKPLEEATRAGDNVLAIIKSTAVNQDGRSQGLTAPNGEAQRRLLKAALRKAKIAASDVSYVEAHGSGTSLGDPIELHALQDVYLEGRTPENRLYVGSVKTNIGHAESAAGMAGVIKTILMMKARQIAPHADFRTLNPHILWRQELASIPEHLVAWRSHDDTVMAGVSAFGFSGTNAHVILVSAPATARGDAGSASPHIFKLSAKSRRSLRRRIEDLRVWVTAHPEAPLGHLAFTLNCGRDDFAFRFACVAVDREELLEKLDTAQRADDSTWIDTRARRGEAAPAPSTARRDRAALETCARVYREGAEIRWESLYEGAPWSRVVLPTYPFDRRRYWVDNDPYAAMVGFVHERVWFPADLGAATTGTARWDGTVYLSLGYDDGIAGQLGAARFDVSGAGGAPLASRRTALREALASRSFECVIVDARHCCDDGITSDDSLLFLTLAQLLESAGRVPERVVLLTSGLYRIGAETEASVSGAALTGMLRVLGQEDPRISTLHIDVDASFTAATLHTEMQAADGYTSLIAWRGGRRFLPRLQPKRAVSTPLTVTGEGVVLVSGGTSGLGLLTARVLADHGARHLALLSRRGIKTREDREAVEALRARGVRVDVLEVDVTEAVSLEKVVDDLKRNYKLRGVVHAAGVVADAAIANQTDADFTLVTDPKVKGAWNLHRATLDCDLEFFVMYSSLTSIVGTPGQINYAAGNAFLDAMASYRTARGFPALTINWGAWKNLGVAAGTEVQSRLEEAGISLIDRDAGCALIGDALGVGGHQLVIAAVDWKKYFHRAKPTREFERLIGGRTANGVGTGAAHAFAPLDLQRLRGVTDRVEVLSTFKAYVREIVVRLLRKDADDIRDYFGFAEMGMDSLMAAQMRKGIQEGTGVILAPTVLFDRPSVESLATHLMDALGFARLPDISVRRAPMVSDDDEDSALAQLERELSES
jgi:3-oxoacyl-(acyl-carrier-protein) synthase/acyl carrier protein